MTLSRLLERAARPTLVLVEDPAEVPESPGDPVVTGVTYAVAGDPALGDDHRWGCVVLVVADVAALRRVGEVPPQVGRARAVVAWVGSAVAPVVPDVRPEWPDVVEVDAHLTSSGGASTRLRFRSAALVHEVLGQLARDAGSPGTSGAGGLVLGADVSHEVTVPPDVVVGAAVPAGPPGGPHPVTGRRAVTLLDEPVAADEGVFTPAGFRGEVTRGVVDLPVGPVTPATVAALRDARGVRIGPSATVYDVAALALAGVPLLAGPEEPGREEGAPWEAIDCRAGLDGAVADLLTADVDLDDPLRREEHSVRLRRAARGAHSLLSRRIVLAERAGVRATALPSVSVLLATRRPDLLPFALTQVAKQRRPVELVLAAHGFIPDPGVLREHLGDRSHQVLALRGETRFGDVLQAAADAASGDVVLKMDDDDWYGPDVVDDLLWARRTSGADLVGMAAEMVYLEPLGLTVRRRGPAELPATVVAGGTMMLDRSRLRELGGFRSVTRFVDAQLLAAVRGAGGTVHRTQGLGYLLRRGDAGHQGGHTWGADLGYFLRRRSVAAQWRGFRPSALLTYDDSERPSPPRLTA